ncbi:MAG: 4'-phosphopantetheinyl transferase superfamily protein [Pseudomonadota bacterium]
MSSSVQVSLWCWRLDGPDDERDSLEAALSPPERERAGRFVFDDHRRDYIFAHGRMRQLLGGLLGVAAKDVGFVHNEHDKPTLAGNELFFNLSHAGGYAALAVSSDVDLGVDIERLRPIEPGLSERFFSRRENRSLASLDGDDWLAGFFRIWTGKEAVVKAIGLGLSVDLSSFDIDIGADQGCAVLPSDEADHPRRRLRYKRFPVDAAVIGCVAVCADREIEIVRQGF